MANQTEKQAIAARLIQARKAKKYATAAEFAEKNGFIPNTYQLHESEARTPKNRGFKRSTARDYASALGVSLAWLLTGEGRGPDDPAGSTGLSFTHIRIIGDVQAGAWREAMEWPIADHLDLPVPVSREFPSAPRFGLMVRGDSMDAIYREGTILICVRYADIGRVPKDGERVIIQRRNQAGHVEATVKEISIRPDGSVWLLPKSTSPEHQPIKIGVLVSPDSPVPLAADANATDLPDNADIEVVALVDQSFQFER